MLSPKQLKDVCLINNGSYQCRYLAEDENDSSKFYCLKKSLKAKEIDAEVDDFLDEMKRKGKNPQKMTIPIGNNCSGYIILRHKEQGYDKDL